MPDSSFKFPNFQNDVDQRDEEKKKIEEKTYTWLKKENQMIMDDWREKACDWID